eukprot:1147887-Pelagomonas_calceolata.AAC.4
METTKKAAWRQSGLPCQGSSGLLRIAMGAQDDSFHLTWASWEREPMIWASVPVSRLEVAWSKGRGKDCY